MNKSLMTSIVIIARRTLEKLAVIQTAFSVLHAKDKVGYHQ